MLTVLEQDTLSTAYYWTHPDLTEKIVDWATKNQNKQKKTRSTVLNGRGGHLGHVTRTI